MGGALGMPEECSSLYVSHHCEQWPSFWSKALDYDSATSM